MTLYPASPFARIVHKLDPHARLLRATPLTGGISAQVTRVDIEHPDGTTQVLIVRQHGVIDLDHDPQIASHEYRLLQILHDAGLPTPAPYLADESGDIFPTPYIVVDFLEGKPEYAPADLDSLTRQLAAQLVAIHQLDISRVDLSFLPDHNRRAAERIITRPNVLDDSLNEKRIRDTLDSFMPVRPRNPSALLHGDYWSGNILWQDDMLVGVIDWEDATLGDPVADVAKPRLEILWAYGVDAMHSFTRYYQALNPLDFTDLPYWDLIAALRVCGRLSDWALDADTERAMRAGHQWFIAQAFASL